jgi:alkanesulfonate monooxygenase SsuD/methylene tetrahydromethanopterin reductase-like flavin-dependent oxidoreductase (luciferase family)
LTKAKFGCQLPQERGDFEDLIEVANECENLGYDSVWAYDHLSPFWVGPRGSLECWTVLSAIAERTRKIMIGSLVTNVNLRNPALLAKMSSTVDNISDGRLILGLGTGDRMSRHELLSNGFEFSNIEERVERLRETIHILKAMWNEDEAFFDGNHYKLMGALNYPKPRRRPGPPIWIGGKHPKILDVVAETADGWNYWGLSKEELEKSSEYLSVRCSELKRAREEIIKSWSGPLTHLPCTGKNQSQMTRNMMEELQRQSDKETKYFIASFGAQTNLKNYEAFAEAVRNLS